MANKIRELRRERGLTVAALAEKTGLSQSYITRLEGGQRGKRGMPDTTAETLATALETDVPTLMDRNSQSAVPSLREDAEPYDPQHDDLLLAFVKRRENVLPYRVNSNVLDRAGIAAGDVVFLDISATAVEAVTALDIVVARIYGESSLTAVTVIRQFVPPSLLITNSSTRNMPMLDLDADPVAIKGVVIGKHTSFRK